MHVQYWVLSHYRDGQEVADATTSGMLGGSRIQTDPDTQRNILFAFTILHYSTTTAHGSFSAYRHPHSPRCLGSSHGLQLLLRVFNVDQCLVTLV